jgi:hypothetical protein
MIFCFLYLLVVVASTCLQTEADAKQKCSCPQTPLEEGEQGQHPLLLRTKKINRDKNNGL